MFRGLILFFLISAAKADLYTEDCLNYTIYPLQYKLNIIPYILKDTSYYYCDITIDVIANAPDLRTIELDAKDLEILDGSIKVLDGSRDIVNEARPYEFDEELGKLYIYLREPLRMYNAKIKGGQFVYSIKMTFNKYIQEDSNGLFLVKYFDEEERDYKYLYTSRFSPNKAKYSFPCFDNPRFEAVFKFKVYIMPQRGDLQYTNTSLVISQELKRESNKENYIIIDYIPSPQVALHQVGFHHSTFASKESRAVTNDTLIVWAPPNELKYYDFILSYGLKIITLIREFSGVNRTLVQGPINIVAVPKNLDGYEVGSWNLLTNSASRIAFISQLTSIKQLELLKFELAQHLSRLWLGNPGEIQRTRWKEEWLKEGMATYFAYYFLAQYDFGARAVRRPLGMYGLEMKHKAMSLDWHHSTPSLASFNQTLAVEIPSRYSELVMMKTGAIWWMLENWLDMDRLHQSFVHYINRRRGQFISITDLNAALDKDTVDCAYQFFNGSTASRILNSWFHQHGYPVVNVQVLRDRTPNAIQLKQKRFSFIQDVQGSSNYLIPISYLVQNNDNCFNCHQPRFTISEQIYTFGENLNGGWIILNRNASGYYRVNYDEETWRLIAKSLKQDVLSVDEMNRAQIVNDAFALYTAGQLNRELAEDVLGYLDNERSPVVWDAAIDGFQLLKIEGAACRMTKHLFWEWEEFMKLKLAPIYDILIKDKDHQLITRHFRRNIINFACELEYPPCISYLKHLHQEYTRGRQRLEPDTREALFYMLANETRSFENKLSTIEMEDKVRAENMLRRNNRFLIRLPYGEPRPMPIMSTETPKPAVTEKYQLPENQPHGGCGRSNSVQFLFVLCLACTLLNV